MKGFTLSYSLDISWNIIQSSFLLALASLMIALMILNGSRVEPSGKPTWLPPWSILCLTIMDESLLFISLTNALRVVSRRVIGLVRFNSHSQSAGFGIGYTVACFQAVGISLWIQHKLTNCQSAELMCEAIWR